MKTIYRIEHPESGNGIWHHLYDCGLLLEYHSNYNMFGERHADYPTMFDDADLDLPAVGYSQFYCACSSLDNLYAWFPINIIPELINLGFRVYKLQVSDFRESPYQVVFRKEWILSKTDISNMFNLQTLKQNDRTNQTTS
jgi:hypothetical protein